MAKQLTDEEIAQQIDEEREEPKLRLQAARVSLEGEAARSKLLEREADRSYQFHVALRVLQGGAITNAKTAMRVAGELIALDKEDPNA